MQMTEEQPVATLIGDLVGSRRASDRERLQQALVSVLRDVNQALSPLQFVEITIGDEFQGAFATVAGATEASLLIQLELLSRADGAESRYGLGYGPVTIFDAARAPASQDGPGWWSARAAIDRAKWLSESPRTPFVRTCFGFQTADGSPFGLDGTALEAYLMCRDAAIDRMSGRQRRLLLGLLRGRTQADLAAEEEITQGAVSQTLHRSGALAIELAQRRLLEFST